MSRVHTNGSPMGFGREATRCVARILRASATVATTVALAGTGAAFAFWATGGSGVAGATSGVIVNQTSIARLDPSAGAALSGNFDNPGKGPVDITAVTAVVGAFRAQAISSLPACTQADFTITGTSNDPGQLNPGSGVGAWSGLTLSLAASGSNQDNCMNLASVPINYTAKG
jgi:hypothetical protein